MKKITLLIFIGMLLFIMGCKKNTNNLLYLENMQLAGSHALYIDDNYVLQGFGDNSVGQLGDVSYVYVEEPQYVLEDVKCVFSKGFTTAVIKNDNSLWMCGYNEDGQLGSDAYTEISRPSLTSNIANNNEVKIQRQFVKVFENVKTIDVGYSHTAIVLEDGSLYTCGNNEFGQLGTGNNLNMKTPVKIGENFKDVSVSLGSTYALKEDGSLWSCGLNDNGQLGIGSVKNSNVLVKIMNNVKKVYSDFYTCAAIKRDNSLWMWGSSDGAFEDKEPLITVPTKRMEDVEKISLGLAFNIVKKEDGSVWGWGNNVYGQIISQSDKPIISEPIKLSNEILDFDCNSDSTMIKMKNGKKYIQGGFFENTEVKKEYISHLPNIK